MTILLILILYAAALSIALALSVTGATFIRPASSRMERKTS